MLRTPRVMTSVLVLSVGSLVTHGTLLPADAAAQAAAQPSAQTLWSDYAHYVMIARPELAGQAAAQLMELPPGDVLDAVEASRYDPTNIFPRTGGMETIREVSMELEKRVQQARIERSREEDRIAADIALLNQGARAYSNATERLTAAGQFAAPQLLAALLDESKAAQHPQIMRAMIDIGRPLVAPLSIALPALNPVAQNQVARVLADIGYPQALPALKRVIENPQTDAAAREAAVAAFNQIGQDHGRFLQGNPSAADLYLALGEGAYSTATTTPGALDGFDASNDTGVLWRYNPQLTLTGGPGLAPIVVPGQILGDVQAMQAAETALALNPDLDPALSLYLRANLRRENRLPEGATDPSYASTKQPASFYAMVAGPTRLRDVLDRALTDDDSELALDAIAGLSATASLDALQPLVRGLGYPDRRVRFRSAEALAYAMPTESFSNDFRVVPVLADALRQGEASVALVVADSQDGRNTLISQLVAQGYQTVDADSVGAAAGQVGRIAGVDLLVVQGSGEFIRDAIADSKEYYKVTAAPVLALSPSAEQPRLSADFRDDPRITVTAAEGDTLAQAIKSATASFSGEALTTDESTAFALSALSLLRDIAGGQTVYKVSDALPAIIAASTDPRPAVAQAAGDVLSRIDDPTAQEALAVAATQATGETQAALLIDLAESANAHGNLIPAELSDEILNLVKTTQGDLAIAAAQAHGALALPTRNAVDLIVGE